MTIPTISNHRRTGALLLALILFLNLLPVVPGRKAEAAQQTVSGVFDYGASAQLFADLNAQRAAAGLPALGWDSSVEWFATQRAAELFVLNSHLRPDGTSFAYGENYIVGAASSADATAAFMASPAHSSNILSASYTGVACAVFYSGGRSFWVQIFTFNGGGSPTNSGSLSESRTVTMADNAQPQVGEVDDRVQIEAGSYIMAGGKVNGKVIGASWSSDDPSVVRVSDDGKIVGVQPGYAVVTADFGNGEVKRILVTVTGGAPAPAPDPASGQSEPQGSGSELLLDPTAPPATSAAAEAQGEDSRPSSRAAQGAVWLTSWWPESTLSLLPPFSITGWLRKAGTYLRESRPEQKLRDGFIRLWKACHLAINGKTPQN